MESRSQYFLADREAVAQSKRARVLAEIKKLNVGDPIAIEIGSDETHMIVLYSFFMGLTSEGKVRFVNVNPARLKPELLVEDVDPERVRPHGYIDGFKRDGLFEKEEALRVSGGANSIA